MKNQSNFPGKIFSGLYLSLFMFISFLLLSVAGFSQESVEINGQDVGSWFERNWMWVSGVVLLLLLIIIFGSRSSGKVRKTTTVVKDTYGNVKSVTTTEEKP